MKPDYVKVRIPGGPTYNRIKETLRSRTLFTVCEEARCPNVSECWDSGTATFMILGSNCSRGCRFCSVTHGRMLPLDPDEPRKVSEAVSSMGLKYTVITSVDRDDLEDQGSSHFASVIESVKSKGVLVESLIPDFQGREDLIDRIVVTEPAVIAHNIETVKRLTPKVRDPRAGYDQSLHVLRYVKNANPGQITKSSIMLGLGETDEEVAETFMDLRKAGVDIVTLGQYLRPSRMQLEVVEYSPMSRFKMFESMGYEMGFQFVASGPLVRSSYRAAEAWIKRRFENGAAAEEGKQAIRETAVH
ncbi:MAG: lipoyl synthase [Candidatus Thermoplasmatota archaeon]|nr:lipoyl synthase [Candidatus Thermoplasmatota archaeon]